MLLAWPDAKRGRIVIHADRPQAAGLSTRGPHAAAVAPVLAVPARPALCPVTVTWEPSVVGASGLTAEASWRAAARSVARAIG